MLRKESLERKLREIQDLKKEKYVGTVQAWAHINSLFWISSYPGQISCAINHRLRTQLDRPSLRYEATPEKIVGLLNEFDEIIMDMDDLYPEQHVSDIFLGLPLHNSTAGYDYQGENIKYLRMETEQIEEGKKRIKKSLTSIFLEANKQSMNNRQFGELALKFVFDNHLFSNYIANRASKTDWDYVISKNNMSNIMRELRRSSYFSNINLYDRIEKIFRDQVDHRLENRREILTDFLALHGFSSFEQALSSIEYGIGERKKLYEDEEDSIFINTQKNYLKYDRFIRHTLVSDRNFVKRYLKN